MAQAPIGIFADNKDIGNPQKKGSSKFNPSDQTYTIKGAGYNIWFGRDEFQYLFNKIEGDFIATANFELVGKGVDLHRKVGWMIRDDESENAPHISATLHGDGLTVLQWRALKGAFMRDPQDEIFTPKGNYNILQIEKLGKEVIFRVAHTGEPLQEVGRKTFEDLPNEVLIGLFVCSHNPQVVETAKVWNVRITKTVPQDYFPYDDVFLDSRLETVNILTGKRKVVYYQDGQLEAPNWMPNGKELLINKDGYLYKVPLEGGELEKFNTDFAIYNNNDHGISKDGKMLALSHHRYEMLGNGSTVYVVPIEGGQPQIVTDSTPSYWHGWNPNGKSVLYVGYRGIDTTFNIYEADIKTKKRNN